MWLCGVAVVGVATVPSAGAQEPPPSSVPTTTSTTSTTEVEETPTTLMEGSPPLDPSSWTASVTLGCAASSAQRTVDEFSFTVDEGQHAQLFLATPLPDGSERLEPIGVGSTVAAGAPLRWSVDYVGLGPWPLDEVSDACAPTTTEAPSDPVPRATPSTLPATGSAALPLLGLLGIALLSIGLPLALRARR
jgi:hypothetical protein